LSQDRKPPAEQITELLAELHDRVETREAVLRYREVNRGGGRRAAVADFAIHRTRRPGLLDQLSTIQATADTAPVKVLRWERDEDDPCQHDGEPKLCRHGRWVHDRTEQRPVAGLVTVGAAVPGGSPGWDADGALSALPSGGSFESEEPIGDAWHVADGIRQGLRDIGKELHDAGWRPPDTLVSIALADEDTGKRIAARLRSLVSRARVAAGYDAPAVPLRDVYCPDCGGSMHVRADASSAVWCAGAWVVEGPARDGEAWPVRVRCGATWPRGSWAKLLAEATTGERMVG
jgi:hypothetical protein